VPWQLSSGRGLTVAKARKAPKKSKKATILAARRPHGILRKRGNDDITTPDFQLAPEAIEGIAEVIVELWNDENLRKAVMKRKPQGFATDQAVIEATNLINAADPTYNFTRCVIISEEEHDNGYRMEKDEDVVFVLPSEKRIVPNGASLLHTAKLLMACTPNGI
jgi:hypothetical protein